MGILWNLLHGQQAGQSPQQRGIQPQMSVVPTNPALYCKPHLELAAGFPTLYKSHMRTWRGKGQASPSHQPGAVSASSLEVMTHHRPSPTLGRSHTLRRSRRSRPQFQAKVENAATPSRRTVTASNPQAAFTAMHKCSYL